MNKDKSIKDLKERNDKLKNQYELLQIRNHHQVYVNKKLEQENKQLKDNWNKLKEIAKSQSDFKLKCHNESLWFEVDELLNKMKELESRDSNE